MGAKRALIIGSDRDSFLPVEQFLESRGLISTVALNYKEGFEKLFYEKPDLTIVFELISYKLSPTFIDRINGSGYFEVVDIKKGKIRKNSKPVIILEGIEHLNKLIDFLKLYLDTGESKPHLAPVELETEEKGDLKEISYPKLLLNLYRDKRSGVLIVNSRVKLKVYLAEGIPIFAEGGEFETALGKMILDSEKISKADHERAVDIAVKKKQRIGDVLVEMGLVSPHELNESLELQLREKLIRGFNCLQGTYSFKPKSDFVGRIVGHRINLHQVLYEGVKRFVEEPTIEKILFEKEGNPHIELSPTLREEVSGISLGPKESRFIQLLKDKSSISDIVRTSRLGMSETLKILYFLQLLGLLKISKGGPDLKAEKLSSKKTVDEHKIDRKKEVNPLDQDVVTLEEEIMETELELPKVEVDKSPRLEKLKDFSFEQTKAGGKEKRKEKKEVIIDEVLKIHVTLSEKTYYEILDVEKDSRKEDIRTAYFNLAKKFHPDTHPDFDKDIKERAEEIFMAITTAYQTLSDNEKRAEYDSQIEVATLTEAKTSYEAEIAYRKAEVLFKQRKYTEAEQEFKNAVRLSPNEATYIGAFAWATFVGTMDKDRVLHDVEKQLQRAITLNPRLPQTYYYLGCVYKYAENERKAEESFANALEYNPEYIEAKRELRLIQMRKSEKKEDKSKGKNKKDKSFWPSLFNK